VLSSAQKNKGQMNTCKFGAVLLLLVVMLEGCASATADRAVAIANENLEKQDSPFRWEAISVNGGSVLRRYLVPMPSGPTLADIGLQADIKKQIAKLENSNAKDQEIEVVDIKKWEIISGIAKEVWVIQTNSGKHAYIVEMRVSQTIKNGVEFKVIGPTPI
jgi:hypothetical protein